MADAGRLFTFQKDWADFPQTRRGHAPAAAFPRKQRAMETMLSDNSTVFCAIRVLCSPMWLCLAILQITRSLTGVEFLAVSLFRDSSARLADLANLRLRCNSFRALHRSKTVVPSRCGNANGL